MSSLFHAMYIKIFQVIEGRWCAFATCTWGLTMMLLCGSGSAQVWNWTTDKVARGTTSSIAVDAGQNLHVTYLTRDAKVYYSLRPVGASRWFTLEVLDSTHANTNVWPRVVADKHGIPHLCVSFGRLLRDAQLDELHAGGPHAAPAYWAMYFCVETN